MNINSKRIVFNGKAGNGQSEPTSGNRTSASLEGTTQRGAGAG